MSTRKSKSVIRDFTANRRDKQISLETDLSNGFARSRLRRDVYTACARSSHAETSRPADVFDIESMSESHARH